MCVYSTSIVADLGSCTNVSDLDDIIFSNVSIHSRTGDIGSHVCACGVTGCIRGMPGEKYSS